LVVRTAPHEKRQESPGHKFNELKFDCPFGPKRAATEPPRNLHTEQELAGKIPLASTIMRKIMEGLPC